MEQNCLGNISIGFEFLWNRLRQIAAVQLTIDVKPGASIDAAHLGDTLKAAWPDQAPTLILAIQNLALLQDVLERARPDSGTIVFPQDLLQQSAWLPRLQRAQDHGMSLMVRCGPGSEPNYHPLIGRKLMSMTPQESQAALRISLIKQQEGDEKDHLLSPACQDQVYESVWSRSLMEHLLDQQHAWAVLGWPLEDVLHDYRHKSLGPSQHQVIKVIEAIDSDASRKVLEQLLGQDPVLAFRFLRFIHSPALGLQTKSASLYHGLMLLGDLRLRSWLLELLPQANSDINLNPIRMLMVTRAHLMAHLLAAGEDEELRREIYLCGLFSQIDLLLGQKLGLVLHQLPLPERIQSALLRNSGPYLPYLRLAKAIEKSAPQELRKLCKTYKLPLDEVNRAILQTLASVQSPLMPGRLLG